MAEHVLVGDNFNPEVGFLRRDDFRHSYAAARFSPRPRSIKAVRQFFWQGDVTYIENGAGQPRDANNHSNSAPSSAAATTSASTSETTTSSWSGPFRIGGVTIPVGGYDFSDVR